MKEKAFCSKCCKEQLYDKSTRPIKFGINDKLFAMIEGVVYTCSVCGAEVNIPEAFAEHEKIARKEIEKNQHNNKKPTMQVDETIEEMASEE